MDGDNTAKTFEQGANSVTKETELSSGLHESVNQVVFSLPSSFLLHPLTPLQPAAGEKTQGTGTSIFDKQGAVGKMFNGEPPI